MPALLERLDAWSRKSAAAFFFCLLAALTFSSALTEITFMATLVIWVFWRFRERAPFSALPSSVLWPFLGFVLLAMLSAVWSEKPGASVRGIFKVLQQGAVFVLAFDLFRETVDLRRFERVFLAVVSVLIVNGFFQYFTGRDFLRGFHLEDSGAGARVSASFGSYGKLSGYLVLTIPFFACWAIGEWRGGKARAAIFPALAAAGLLALLFLTKSRGAWLAFGCGAVLMALIRRKWGILLGLALAGALFFISLPESMRIHLDAERKEQSIVERMYLWERAADVIRAKPLTGTGINTYAAVHQKYDRTKSWRVRNYYAHNGYLQLAAETGLPCLFLLLMFFVAYFLFSIRSLGTGSDGFKRLGLLTGALNFLFFCAVDTAFHSPLPVMSFWYLLGAQIAYAGLSAQRPNFNVAPAN